MPALQMMLNRLNKLFSDPGPLSARKELWAPGRRLSDVARDLRTAPPEILSSWAQFLDTIPPSLQEALRAVIYSALSSQPPVEITFAWMPGYDFELTLSHAPDSKTSKGGITVIVRSRYPNDRHPLA